MTDDTAPLDFFIEPEWATDLLLELPFFSLIRTAIDPCCGSGNIVRSLKRRGIEASGSDIVQRGSAEQTGIADFFTMKRLPAGIDAIVSNPPYGKAKLARAFIEHALWLKPKLLAVFVENRFLGSQERHPFFMHHRPTCIAFLSSRPSCPPGEMFLAGEIEAAGGKQDYCWLIWATWMFGTPAAPVWLKRSSS